MVQLMQLPSPLSLSSFKSRLVVPFWYRLTQLVLEKRLLNGCGGWWQLCVTVRCPGGCAMTHRGSTKWLWVKSAVYYVCSVLARWSVGGDVVVPSSHLDALLQTPDSSDIDDHQQRVTHNSKTN